MKFPPAHKKHRKRNAVLFCFQCASTTFCAGIVIDEFRKSGLSADERCIAVLNSAFFGFLANFSLSRQAGCESGDFWRGLRCEKGAGLFIARISETSIQTVKVCFLISDENSNTDKNANGNTNLPHKTNSGEYH